MSMTPVEVRHLQLKRGLFGYRRRGVNTVLEEVAESFEGVWRERAGLAERVEALEAELARHVELESLLRSTLVSAERAAQDLKEQARREADIIVSEANAEGRRLLRDAITEKERLLADARRVQAILRSALEVVEGTDPGLIEPGPEPAAPIQATPTKPEEIEPSSTGDGPDAADVRRLAG